MNRPGLLIPTLALAVLVLGWRVFEAWTGPVGPAGAGVPAPAASAGPRAAPQAPDLAGAVVAIVARPVFRPDRSPFREESGAAPARRNYEAELARFTLLGVVLRGGNRTGIVVENGGGGRGERWEVMPGDELPGFKVRDVETDGLTLAADDREFLLPLYAGAPKGPAGSVPPRTETSSPPPGQAAGAAVGPAAGTRPSSPAPAVSPQPSDIGRGRPYRPTYYPGRR